ncbi:type II toxin-antitoxin system RelE family toxin, partial [Xenorhabdus bovienii]
MIYKLEFEKRALKEWKNLGYTIREQLKKKLAERLKNPHVPASR